MKKLIVLLIFALCVVSCTQTNEQKISIPTTTNDNTLSVDELSNTTQPTDDINQNGNILGFKTIELLEFFTSKGIPCDAPQINNNGSQELFCEDENYSAGAIYDKIWVTFSGPDTENVEYIMIMLTPRSTEAINYINGFFYELLSVSDLSNEQKEWIETQILNTLKSDEDISAHEYYENSILSVSGNQDHLNVVLQKK
jgi:hypothetical protein